MSQHPRGTPAPNANLEEDRLAVGGLRDATAAVTRLPLLATFGEQLGKDIAQLLDEHPDWVKAACSCIGKEGRAPPPEALGRQRGRAAGVASEASRWPSPLPRGVERSQGCCGGRENHSLHLPIVT